MPKSTPDHPTVCDDRPVPGDRELSGSDIVGIADVGEYIADVIAELRAMADKSGQRSLAVLLELAQREASQGTRRPSPGKAAR